MAFTLPENIATRPIAVVGAGTLGRRIALMLATQGAEVRLVDPSADARAAGAAYVAEQLARVLATLPAGKPGRVVAHADLAEGVADAWLVVESVPERLDLKIDTFAQLDALAPADAILASNSSSYPTSQVIGKVARPERVLNTHYMMPPAARAVELMSCGRTDERVIALLADTLPHYGLTPYVVQRESVGFIYNRIWAAIKREALAVVAEGVATPEVVDAIYTQTNGGKSGPFRRMDAVGLDIVLSIEEHYAQVRPGLPEGPRDLLKRMIAEGRLGAKSGSGFYDDYAPRGEEAKS
ncbi:3-hydroxyacyl-CoA dehydrogenase family protein [Burkholderia guangdongensis]|uniref:3-hydroxyacyl-CoA dehydrogenase family protein n=1 Tax=Burkholderia guangdongensis TaxID=1792500 RepID=UPI0015C7ED87|nr:3-hydroxyacyl-CoA dehydrogenase family protein [Burkholderia guangdongensis]